MVDSGAIDNVGPQSVGQGLDVRPNQASKIGACYHTASGHPIVNQGEKSLSGWTGDWKPINMTVQICDVTKTLGSVRRMCEAGNRVIFDDDGSMIINKRTGQVTQIEKKPSGVYVLICGYTKARMRARTRLTVRRVFPGACSQQ